MNNFVFPVVFGLLGLQILLWVVMWFDIRRLETPQSDTKAFHTIVFFPFIGFAASGWYFLHRDQFDDGIPLTNESEDEG